MKYKYRPLFDFSSLCFCFDRKLHCDSFFSGTADLCCRTDLALWLSVWHTYDRTKLDQSLIKVSRTIFWNHFLQCRLYRRTDFGFHNIFSACQNPGHHTQHISIHRRFWYSKRKRSDSSRRIISNSCQCMDFFI